MREEGPVDEGVAHGLEGLTLTDHGVDAFDAALVLGVDLSAREATVRGDRHAADEVGGEDLGVLATVGLVSSPVGEEGEEELGVQVPLLGEGLRCGRAGCK